MHDIVMFDTGRCAVPSLAALRHRCGLSKAGLARRAGVSPVTIYKAELGGRVTIYARTRLAHALGVSPAALLEPEPGDRPA